VVFLLVLAHPGSPGQRAIKQLLCYVLLLLYSSLMLGCNNLLLDNEVDGCALLHVTEKYVFAMFPEKICVARKLMTLVDTHHSNSLQQVW